MTHSDEHKLCLMCLGESHYVVMAGKILFSPKAHLDRDLLKGCPMVKGFVTFRPV